MTQGYEISFLSIIGILSTLDTGWRLLYNTCLCFTALHSCLDFLIVCSDYVCFGSRYISGSVVLKVGTFRMTRNFVLKPVAQ